MPRRNFRGGAEEEEFSLPFTVSLPLFLSIAVGYRSSISGFFVYFIVYSETAIE